MTPEKKTALDVLRELLRNNSMISQLEFGIYHPTLTHFKEQTEIKRRDPFEATEHSRAKSYFKLKREDLLIVNGLEERITNLLPGQALQVLSITYIKQLRSRIHIPMIDLEIEPKPENVEFAVASIKALRQAHGALLLSGGSYHWWGYELMTQAEWESFMHLALLLDDVADRRWIGHRLLDGFSNLRISPKGRHNYIPYVVQEF